MNLRASLQSLMNSAGLAMLMSLVPRTAIALRFLSPMTAPQPRRLQLERPCSMEAKKTRFSPARPMEATAAVGSSSSWRMTSADSSVPKPARCVGVAELDLVVVDPQVDQLGRLAADDHLVVAGVLQLRARRSRPSSRRRTAASAERWWRRWCDCSPEPACPPGGRCRRSAGCRERRARSRGEPGPT